MAHASNSSMFGEAEAGGSLEARNLKPVLATQDSFSIKNTKINWVWWHTPVVPATQEAEVGGSTEPRRLRLQVSCDHTAALQPW